MFRYRVNAIVLTIGIICAFSVGWSPARSQEVEVEETPVPVEEVQEVEIPKGDPEAAETTEKIDIPVEELQLLVKPLTLENLENEAAGWMQVLKAKVQEISEAEIAVNRQNASINQQQTAASELDKAKEALKEAEEAQAKATPGTPEYGEVTKKVEEAKENLKKAEEAIGKAAEAEKQLKEDEALQDALKKAERTGNLDAAKETLKKAEKERENIDPGSAEYQKATEKIDKLKEAIATYEKTREVKQKSLPDTPEFQKALQELEKAEEELQKAQEAIDGVEPKEAETTEQSSKAIDKATTLLEKTEVEADGEEKVAGSPEVVDGEDNLEKKQEQLEKTSDKLEESAEQESELKNQLVATVTEFQSQQTAIIERFSIILDELERKGGKADAYRKYIEAVSTVQIDVKDTEALGVQLTSWLKSEEGGMRWVGNISKFFGILVITIIASQLLAQLTLKLLLRYGDKSQALREFIVILIKRGGVVIGVLLAITSLGVNLGPLLAVAGGLSFVLVFALQSNVGNFASGLTLMFAKPFDVGDEVKIAGVWGWVDAVTLAHTKVKGFGGEILTIPNDLVWGDVIENLSNDQVRTLAFEFRISFDEDLAKVKQLLVEAMESHPGIIQDPAPEVTVSGIEEYYINIEIGGFTKTKIFWNVHHEVLCIIKERLDQEGIKLAAIPTQNISLQETDHAKMRSLLKSTHEQN